MTDMVNIGMDLRRPYAQKDAWVVFSPYISPTYSVHASILFVQSLRSIQRETVAPGPSSIWTCWANIQPKRPKKQYVRQRTNRTFHQNDHRLQNTAFSQYIYPCLMHQHHTNSFRPLYHTTQLRNLRAPFPLSNSHFTLPHLTSSYPPERKLLYSLPTFTLSPYHQHNFPTH